MNDHSAMADAAARKPVIRLDDARLSLSSADGMVEILRGISLSIDAGQTVGVLGPSGAGKTSLLMIMAGLESLTTGQIDLAGFDITRMHEDMLAALRRDHVGIVFQAFRLIPSMTAIQMWPCHWNWPGGRMHSPALPPLWNLWGLDIA